MRLRALWSLSFAAMGFVILLGNGCATRGYVRSQVAELRQSTDGQMDQVRKEIADVRNSSDQALARAEQAYGAADASKAIALGNAGFREVTQSTVFFATNQDGLSDETKATLDELARQIADRRDLLVDIYGFTDPRGSDQYNYDLGQRRANAVLRYLVAKSPGQLHRFAAVSLGKDAMAASQQSWAQARRVVVATIERTPPTSNNEPPQASAETGR